MVLLAAFVELPVPHLAPHVALVLRRPVPFVGHLLLGRLLPPNMALPTAPPIAPPTACRTNRSVSYLATACYISMAAVARLVLELMPSILAP